MEVTVSLAERSLRIGERVLGWVVTRIAELRAYPDVVTPGEIVSITGKVEQHWPPMVCQWQPVGGGVVEIYVNGIKTAEVKTRDDGYFEWRTAFKEYGTYYIKARFPGDAWFESSESPEVPVRVVTEEEKKKWEQQQFLQSLVPWLIGGGIAVIVAVIAYTIYNEERRRRLLELMLVRRR